MAIVYATKSGAWSDPTVWSTGILPTSADDVYTNAFTVSIDQSISVKSLKKIANASPVIATGGSFLVTASSTITISDGIVAADNVANNTAVLTLSTASVTVTVNANGEGGASTARNAIRVTAAATLTVNGNLTGGSGGTASALNITGGATVVVNGAVTGGGAIGNAYGITAISASAQVTVNGSVTGGLSTSHGISMGDGKLRLNADLRWSATGCAPVQSAVNPPVFDRGGSSLAVTAASDDNWPLLTGSNISLTEGGGGEPVDPKRFLRVAGAWVPIQ
jgi:hypothetical protein